VTLVASLLRTRRTLLADVDPHERLLVRSDVSGTVQLQELDDGAARTLTALPEPVAFARYVPGRRQALLAVDAGGNERHQLYLLDLDRSAPAADLSEMRALTSDPRFAHQPAGVSPDGRFVAYTSNRANGVDFDLWLADLQADEHHLLHAAGTWLHPASGFSPDGRYVAVIASGDRPLDEELVLVDTATGAAHRPLPHPDEAALVGAPAWVSPGVFYASSNVGRDFAAIVRHDLASGETATLPGTGEDCDAEVVAAPDGTVLLVIENRDGASVMTRRTSGARSAIELPEPGVTAFHSIAPPVLSAGGERVYFSLTTPRIGGDVFVFDTAVRRLTGSPAPPDRLVLPTLNHTPSFDGERVPFFAYHPPGGAAPPPVVVMVHGGPESQSRPIFSAERAALLAAGYGVVVPNVRGSTGYGKRYAALDDTTRRLDSVRDLAAVHAALAGAGFDASRAVLWGGSYGGYMVLAGLAFQPSLWAAGVDIVGISDLVTFLENTSDYRRAHREREYGSLAHDRAFLTEASPLTHADAIRAPLFVIHGRNDPRVPVSEAEQLVANLTARGVPCTLRIYEDEGHGLARLDNQLDAYPAAIAFLDEVLDRA
jgi:dipeptidyl aminopeptidase/acylaminoacyl peptidase